MTRTIILRIIIALLPILIIVGSIHFDFIKGSYADNIEILIAGIGVGTLLFATINMIYVEYSFILSRRQNAIDIISKWRSSDTADQAGIIRKETIDMSPENIEKWLSENDDERVVVTDVLNFLETVALAVKHKALDEEVLKDFFEDIVKSYWLAFGDWIIKLRKRPAKENAFTLLEWLHNKWNPQSRHHQKNR